MADKMSRAEMRNCGVAGRMRDSAMRAGYARGRAIARSHAGVFSLPLFQISTAASTPSAALMNHSAPACES